VDFAPLIQEFIMSKRYSVLVALPLFLAAAPPATAANIIADGSFETPSLAGTRYGYCYPQAAFAVNCVGEGVEASYGVFGPWNTFEAVAAVMIGGGSWGLNGLPADGVRFGALKGVGAWSQNITIATAGDYRLT
jgi:hypothetical protein